MSLPALQATLQQSHIVQSSPISSWVIAMLTTNLLRLERVSARLPGVASCISLEHVSDQSFEACLEKTMFDHDIGGYSDLVKQLRNGSSKLRMAEIHRFCCCSLICRECSQTLRIPSVWSDASCFCCGLVWRECSQTIGIHRVR